MDIDIYNTYTYITYLVSKNISLKDEVLSNLLTKIVNHKFIDKSLYDYLSKNIENENVHNVINFDLPALMKEFKAIDSGIITNLLDYMETKSHLTSYIMNYKLKYNSDFDKIGEYIENNFDDFLKNNINKDFNTSQSTLIQRYKARAMKKGGLVLRNFFKSIEEYIKYFEKQDQYKFSKKLLRERDKLIQNLSDYDTTIVFGNENNKNYSDFLKDSDIFKTTINDCFVQIKRTIYSDFFSDNSKIKEILNFIVNNISKKDLFLKNIIPENEFNKLPNSLEETKIYSYYNNMLSEFKIKYNDKNNLKFSFNFKNNLNTFFNLNLGSNFVKNIPLKFTQSTVKGTTSNFELLRIMGILNLNENNKSIIIQEVPDRNDPNKKFIKPYYNYNFELLDVSIDLEPENVVQECIFEEENKTISLGFNSILYDNVKIFVFSPNKIEKRCKRLNILISMYNLIYTLKKLGKYNYNLITDWYDKYTGPEKMRFFDNIIKLCFGIPMSSYNVIEELKFHHIALIYDRLTFSYVHDSHPSALTINIRKGLSHFLFDWRINYSKLFEDFLKNNLKELYNRLYYIGGTKFDIDCKKLKLFEDFDEKQKVFKNTINGIKKIKTYSADLDCHIYVEDNNETHFIEIVKNFYENFKTFINQNINNNNLLKILNNIVIPEFNNNGSWTVVKNVKKNLLYKINLLRDNYYTNYFPSQETLQEQHPIYTSIDNGYMIYKERGVLDVDSSRPYLLLRQSIILKNTPCNFIKSPNLFELNLISRSRTFPMYDFFKNVLNNNTISDLSFFRPNMIFVFLQYIYFDKTNNFPNIDFDKNLQYMLFSTWLNYRMNIKPKNNLYRFVHYAKYFHLNGLYKIYYDYYNKSLYDYFNIRNKDYILYFGLNLPKYDDFMTLNGLIETCNTFTEEILLDEAESTPFICPIAQIEEKKLKIEYKKKNFENFINSLVKQEDDEIKTNEIKTNKIQEIDILDNFDNEYDEKIQQESKIDNEYRMVDDYEMEQ